MRALAVLVALLALSSRAWADSVQWDEAIHGELGPNTYLGTFVLGTNTVSGTLWTDRRDRTTDDDSFRLLLDPGLQISDVTIRISSVVGSIDVDHRFSDSASQVLFMNDGLNVSASHDFGSRSWASGEMAVTFSAAPATAPGVYRFEHDVAGPISTAAVVNSYDYTISVEIESITPIPEPGTLALLGAALVGFAVWRRRR